MLECIEAFKEHAKGFVKMAESVCSKNAECRLSGSCPTDLNHSHQLKPDNPAFFIPGAFALMNNGKVRVSVTCWRGGSGTAIVGHWRGTCRQITA
jgi:hypothetical protein